MSTSARPGVEEEVWAAPSPLHSAALDDPAMGLLIFDQAFQIVHATGQVSKLLGVAADRALQLSATQLFSIDAPSAAPKIQTYLLGEQNEPLLIKVKETCRSVRVRAREIGFGYRAVTLEDAGDLHADRDWLTGLATRNVFENRVAEEFKDPSLRPFAILLLDLDRFKPVNETLGHSAGDAVLRLVAKRLTGALRDTEFVARLDGDQFAVLTYQDKDLASMANRLLEVVKRTYLVNGNLIDIGVSIGIALAVEHGQNCEELLKNADLALNYSKASGRAKCSFFNSKMATAAADRRKNELELRRAIALRQLELHYQPQVKMISGKLVGFEALVRWRHPTRGLIPPNDFLPLAEEIGMIVPLGEWVLRTACKQAMQWEDHLVIAVNASPLQFDTGKFADTVARALANTGLPGRRLEIEITEGILLRNEDAVLETLAALREMDVRIAMDDFGTGYASLSQLARFPFDKIKIDRSLAGTAGDHPKNRAIVKAIAALGLSLGVATMAEGVEDADQLERLRIDGCSSVQGYFFGRPIPASEVEQVILNLNKRATEETELKALL